MNEYFCCISLNLLYLYLNNCFQTQVSMIRNTFKLLTTMSSSKFSSSLPSSLPASDRLIWVDCEMTGLEIDKDKLLEIAVIVTEGDTLQTVGKTESIIINCDDESLEQMNSWCVKQHGASGLTQACKDSKISCQEAERMVMDMLKQCTSKGKCPLAGNSVSQDRKFIDKYMPDLASWLHYRTVDVSTIKELTRRWYPQVYEAAPKKGASHRALGDIEDSIAELKYYREKVFK